MLGNEKKCINIKQKINGKIYCKKKKKDIYLSDCINCDNKEYKNNFTKKSILNTRTYKQQKKEKNRYSILYNDLSKRCICDSTYNIELNEVFEGAYRQSSIKYGAICPFCELHHRQFHNDRSFNLEYKCLFQKEFIKLYDYNWYMSVFKINYLYIKKKLTNC